ESCQDMLVANSDGTHRTDLRVRVNFAVNVVAKQSEVLESAFEAVRGTRGFELLGEDVIVEAATTAARRAVQNVGAEPAPAGTYTVVLSSEAGGTLIHESVGHGLEADLNLKGLSVYSGRIGEKVASELITVVDDGRDPGQRGTAAMDDEGTPTQRTVLIEKGVLRTYLSDRRHSEKLGIKRSGNARRESFRYLPICRMTNTMIERGESDPDEILSSVKDGVFVKKMGGGQVDVVSGNFAFEITECFRIRDGKLAEPLRGATLVGQGPKLMSEIDMVGWDLGYSTGTCGKDGQGARRSSSVRRSRARSRRRTGRSRSSSLAANADLACACSMANGWASRIPPTSRQRASRRASSNRVACRASPSRTLIWASRAARSTSLTSRSTTPVSSGGRSRTAARSRSPSRRPRAARIRGSRISARPRISTPR
ncbi:MAG: TldD/PmbA family protein, partial [Chloroflexi bacterium]